MSYIKNISFKMQMGICLGFLTFCLIMSTFTKYTFLVNLAWIVYGLFFIINPVWPENLNHWDRPSLKRGCRIAGVIAIVLGLMIRF
ncbi:MAG: hypothetical protein IJC39_01835 [Firmicutes bacterium]|nr:hypothetical protein [Bacillota bacterium]